MSNIIHNFELLVCFLLLGTLIDFKILFSDTDIASKNSLFIRNVFFSWQHKVKIYTRMNDVNNAILKESNYLSIYESIFLHLCMSFLMKGWTGISTLKIF